MKYTLNTGMVTGLFSGTYNTIWEVTEYDDDGNELEVDYEFNDFMKSIAEEYQNHQDELLDEMDIAWIKSINFTGAYYSPREYNFATDSLDMVVNIDYRAMVKYLKGLEGNEAFAKYLHDHYSSRDGFISFTPDNYSELLEEIVTHGSHQNQAISALINYQTASNGTHELEIMVYEDWSCNGYGGLDYQVVGEAV